MLRFGGSNADINEFLKIDNATCFFLIFWFMEYEPRLKEPKDPDTRFLGMPVQ